MHATQTTKTTAQSTEAVPSRASAALAKAVNCDGQSFFFDPDQDCAVLKARGQLKAALLKGGTKLARLGDALLAAYTDEARWCVSTDSAEIGREATPEEHQRHVKAIEATYDAMRTVGAYRPKNLGELAQKTAVLEIGVDGSLLDDLGIDEALAADREQLGVEASTVEAVKSMFGLISTLDDGKKQEFAETLGRARAPDIRSRWSEIAKKISALHRATFGNGGAAEDPGVVGNAYRAARAAAGRKTHFYAQVDALAAIERIAKSFCTDGTYADYAINPDGIRHISGLVGDLQISARDLASDVSPMVGRLAIERVYWSEGYKSQRILKAEWDAAQAARAANRAEEDDESEEGRAIYIAAERGVYSTAAPDLKAVLWKVGDNLMNELGTASVAEALAQAEVGGDLNEICQAAVYRDLERLAGVERASASTPVAPEMPQLLAAE
jgi:hypothetical protein